jgi:hypothetical protein
MPKKPKGLRDIIGDVVSDTAKVGKGVYKAANWISQPKNQNKVGKGIAENFLSSKEIAKIVSGKGSKKDVAGVVGNVASYVVPYGKLYKGIDMAVKGGKVAKVVRGAAKTGTGIGSMLATDAAVSKGVNKLAPVVNSVTKGKGKKNVVATPKSKTKTKGK